MSKFIEVNMAVSLHRQEKLKEPLLINVEHIVMMMPSNKNGETLIHLDNDQPALRVAEDYHTVRNLIGKLV